MKKSTVRTLIKYGITIAIAGLLTYLVTQNYGLAEANTKVEKYRILCDAFTVPGVIFVMFGLLIKIADCGALDGLSYAMRSFYRVFIPFAAKKDESFWDYIQRKKEARKLKKSTGFILHVGILYLIPAVVFLILFYRIY